MRIAIVLEQKNGGTKMNQRSSITLIAQAFLFSSAVLVVGVGKSYAADADDVKAAVDAYRAALSALDAPKMEALWAHDDSVMLINPADKTISTGWDAVKKNWEMVFSRTSELKVTERDGPHIQVKGDVAWSTGIVNAAIKTKAGDVIPNAPTYEIDVFEKRDGHWLLVSHTALRVPQ
jgi:ketosteroid isomerase-like protein